MVRKMLLTLALLNVVAFGDARRQRRYLVYPDGGPARTQFIIGLGVPVDLKDTSVTVGTVIKFQYDLPTNSSEYTSRIYGFADTISRDIDEDSSSKKVDDQDEDEDDTLPIHDVDNSAVVEDLLEENNTLIDVTFNEGNKRKRSVFYTEGGLENTVDSSEMHTELPLEEAIRRQEMIDMKNMEQMEKEDPEPQRMNRWDFYKIIEHMIERYGYSGRPCLLRTICEAAEVPFTHENGLLGEIGHILFTPSTTKDVLSHHTDNEYHAAERLGREARADCETMFPECESSILDTFTHIGIDTLHSFGLY